MSILDDLVSEIKEEEVDIQIQEITYKIKDEEYPKIEKNILEKMPEGPNIYLALPVPGYVKEAECYLTLERDMPNKYIIGVYERRDGRLLRISVSEINSGVPQKIIGQYAKKLKVMKGN